jgi:hypothetical protein
MFSIVDRTALLIPKNITTSPNPIAVGAQTVQVPSLTQTLGYPAKVDFTLQAGMQVEVGLNFGAAAAEVVTLTAVNATVNPPTISAVFTKMHAAGAFISIPSDRAIDTPTAGVIHGHPGPQPRFDYRQNPLLVPYYNIIQ